MWYTPTVTVEPIAEPVSLVEARRHVRAVDFDDDNQYLKDLIKAARDHIEGSCSARFAAHTLQAECDNWCDLARFPALPLSGVTSITYVDSAGVEQTLADTVYQRKGDGISLKFGQSWPGKRDRSTITVVFEAGFDQCPPAVKHAMLLWIGDAYRTREPAASMDMSTLDALLINHRYYN